MESRQLTEYRPEYHGSTISQQLIEPYGAKQDVLATGETPAATTFPVRETQLRKGTVIRGYGLELQRSLTLTLEMADDGVVVRSGDIAETGYGATWIEAIGDFLFSLGDRLHSLGQRAGRLSDEDEAALRKLRELLAQAS